jgi:hypothetical protein
MSPIAFLLAFAAISLPACASSPPPASRAPAQPAPSDSAKSAAAEDDDPYARMVARAEAGDEAIDFLALRKAYLASPALARGVAAKGRVSELRQSMFAAMKSGDSARVLANAKETLSLVYIDLEAQKGRYQACAALKDDECARRGKRVEQGLLRSIVSSGDGRSCATAWNAVTIDEEYFVLRMLDMQLRQQAVVSEGGRVCDKMDVTDETGQPRTHYFDIGAMMQAMEPKR